ncbi:MAG: sulfotransferase family 2 domain-containing protein [Phycisphaerales bacterium]
MNGERQSTREKTQRGPLYRSLTAIRESTVVVCTACLPRGDGHLDLPSGNRRIYHFHIRKTGGTSVNRAFMGLGPRPSERVVQSLQKSPINRAKSGPYTFTRHSMKSIELGSYDYAHSHFPYDLVSIPEDTFTFTILRDPVRRVISHYRMLRDLSKDPNNIAWRTKGDMPAAVEYGWLGDSFDDFLERAPISALKKQIHTFSIDLNPVRAEERIMACDAVLWTEELGDCLDKLGSTLGISLELKRDRQSIEPFEPNPSQLANLKHLLADEIDMLARLRSSWNPASLSFH